MKEDSKESSFFDEYDKENGYEDESIEQEYNLTDILYSIYDFAISKQRMSFKHCEEMDFIAYIDYLNYIFNRKEEENNYNNYEDIEDY
ncbi:hypothetical protein [Clostridium tarantellae]|uniref:Uncharacterized protein n=1 Tax=Clostridium tarantellae TaxID=39493 RepID=A0A6I1MSD2_9CLOT|nr:hypothetical protein [Clostridium tarantellae]MPQ45358.1 hypothetical protein [Clostridium tarantellae]